MRKSVIKFQKGLSLSDFLKDYGDESQCFEALLRMKWPSGFKCPKCGSKAYCRLKQRNALFQCNDCHGQISITAGTIYHSTKLPLTKWFLAMYLMTQSKNGISQLALARQLDVSINTGAMVYRKLARTMLKRNMNNPLPYKVEIDEAYGEKKEQGGRGSKIKRLSLHLLKKMKQGILSA